MENRQRKAEMSQYNKATSVKWVFSVLTLTLFLTCSLLVLHIGISHAYSSSGFNPGHIIDDGVFTNSNSMSIIDIQNFLNTQMPSCDVSGQQSITYNFNSSTGRVSNSSDPLTTSSRAVYGKRYADWYNSQPVANRPANYVVNESLAPYVCLRYFIENPSTGQNNLQNPSASISGAQGAASIIYYAAKQYGISPKVILTTLQKEQGLLTDDWPWVNEFNEAMGFNCPDTPQGCSGFAGFNDQVFTATSQYRNYINNPNNFNFIVGNNTIAYAQSSYGCGISTTVNISNRATAALYDYTPYQPDSNVLNNTNPIGSNSGPGGGVQGDNCATYGNRNFWWYFNTWFGSSYSMLGTHPSSSSLYANIPCGIPNYSNNMIGRLYQPDTGDYFYTLYPSEACSAVKLGYIWDGLVMQSASGSNIIPVYRLSNSSHHYYTTDSNVRANDIYNGYNDEGVAFYAYASSQPNSLPVYSLTDGNTVLLTDAGAEGQYFNTTYNFTSQGIVFYTPNIDDQRNTPVYRLTQQGGQRFYTIYQSEALGAESSGYSLEGTSSLDNFYPDVSNLPVYRLSDSSRHFYTTDPIERDLAVINYGYISEGVGFYTPTSAYPNSSPVYRSTNYITGVHFYTPSLTEYNNARTYFGYTSEGAGWYSY